MQLLSQNPEVQRQVANVVLARKPSRKGSGLMAKYKNMRGLRKSNDSGGGDDRSELAKGGANLLEYSPLGKGENGEGSLALVATSNPLRSSV